MKQEMILKKNDSFLEICWYKQSYTGAFFEHVSIERTCASTLEKELPNVLACQDLDICNIRGQRYDDGSKMPSQGNGLQALFINDHPYACYIHRFAPRLQSALI